MTSTWMEYRSAGQQPTEHEHVDLHQEQCDQQNHRSDVLSTVEAMPSVLY